MTAEQAEASGYRSLTTPYRLPGEQEILDAALDDLLRDGIDAIVIATRWGSEIWRKGLVKSEGYEKQLRQQDARAAI